MRVSLIVAAADNGVIGRAGGLPWRLPADLRRFKALTMSHHLVIGRKTWDSIGRPLPGRTMSVVTRRAPDLPVEVTARPSLGAALEAARAAGGTECFVAGGGEIYRQALPLADRIYLTRVHAHPPGDVRFPDLDPSEWIERERQEGRVDEANPLPHTFLVYDRAPSDPRPR